ncbi:ATP synthase-coupling factor 6, mitochondrial [Collichthys lucidus]|uniref:ATP synthase peripheral stalk subunit F6, mitochondrial n=1 Tax=Collichthys lucidus TaxID=240159 RepID=A0A4U5UG78_COLLU|nr:ATP synthase-coupling factor 6, mitochondrial [Collichthys lucidus]
MAASLLRIGRRGCVKCLQTESWSTLSRTPAAFSTKSGGSKKSSKKTSAPMDPIQKLLLDSIPTYSTKSQVTGGLVDAGSGYEKALAEEISKHQRLYGGGDLTSFPEFRFTELK